jgi:hypothetical protein
VELAHATHSRPAWPTPLISGTPLAGAPRGTVIDEYWRVQKIAPDTFAIGEPQGDLDNFEYLLIGKNRALLIDAGSTGRDIHPALATLTQLPITVIPLKPLQSSSRPCCHEWRHVGSTARRYQDGGLTEREHGNYA